MMQALCDNMLFGIVLCTGTYLIGQWCQLKCKGSPWVNPVLIAMVLSVLALLVFDIPMEYFTQGGDVVSMLLLPATAMLAIPIYNQRKVLKENFWPVVLGCLAGSIANAVTVTLLCKAFRLDELLTKSLLPKSVTAPIAMAVSEQIGGVPAITVAAVIFTGTLGTVIAPALVKVTRLKNPTQIGVALGSCSHVGGTSAAIEMGEIQGAMSSVAIGVSGILTVLIAFFW